MRKIFGWVDQIDYVHNECMVFLLEHPRKRESLPYQYSLPCRWLYRAGIQRQNQPFVIKEYMEGNKMIQEVLPLCNKDDFRVVDLFENDPEMKAKIDSLIKLIGKS